MLHGFGSLLREFLLSDLESNKRMNQARTHSYTKTSKSKPAAEEFTDSLNWEAETVNSGVYAAKGVNVKFQHSA